MNLTAADQIALLASRNASTSQSQNKGSSGSIGIGFSLGAGGSGFSINAAASKSRGNSDGSDLTWTESQIEGGGTVRLKSGSDTTLQGAIVKGKQVVADIGGNLAIESLQDKSTYDGKQNSSGFSISVPIAGAGLGNLGGSISSGRSKIESDYLSVVEQSGIKAGDDGFQVIVGGNTDLKGGVIASTDKAVEDGKNSFNTEGPLTLASLDNKADYKGSSVSVNLGAGISMDGKLVPGGTGVGGGKEEGSAASTTESGISGIAGNQDVRTGDGSNGIGKIFDAQKVQESIDAQTQITQMFGQQASKAIGDYAKEKTDEARVLREQAKREPDEGRAQELTRRAQELEDQWGDQGTLRLAAHTLVGGLSGGPGGAGGAAVGTLTAPLVAEALEKAGIEGPLASTLTAIVSTVAGAVVGGSSGAGAALNEVANNYLNHQENKRYLTEREGCQKRGDCAAIDAKYREISQANEKQAFDVAKAAAACVTDCADLLAQLKWIEADMAGGLQYPSFGDNVSLTQQLSIAKDKVQGQVYQQWCSGNKTGCAVAIASPLFPALAAVAPALAGEAITGCIANPAGCTATINALADGLLADGAVGIAGGAAGKAALERLAATRTSNSAGKLIGSVDNLTVAEKSFVNEMVAGGKTVKIIPTSTGRTADFFIDGTRYELKTMSNVANQTSDGLSKALSSTIMDARGQSGNIIIDARGQAGMTVEIAERGIRRAFSADTASGSKIQSISIVTPQGTVYVPRLPQ